VYHACINIWHWCSINTYSAVVICPCQLFCISNRLAQDILASAEDQILTLLQCGLIFFKSNFFVSKQQGSANQFYILNKVLNMLQITKQFVVFL